MSPVLPTPKPWPMKWIVLAILVSITAYTFLTLHFRKPGPGYRPYQDSKDKATVSRLRSAGYQRIMATVELPADSKRFNFSPGTSGTAAIKDAPGGLPEDLQMTLLEKPTLPESFGEVNTPAEASASFSFSTQFVCRVPDNETMLGDTYLYRRENELAIVTSCERLHGQLLTRSREPIVLVTIPSCTLQPGTYRVLLVGAVHSKEWTLQVH